jgi:hypothetical protein
VIRKALAIVALAGVGCGQSFVSAGPSDATSDTPVGSGDAGGDASVDSGRDAIADAGTDGSGGMDVGADAPADSGGDAGPPWSPVCPVVHPTGAGACLNVGALCEYARVVYDNKLQYDVGCDLLYKCVAGAWSETSLANEYGCVPDAPNATSCPTSYGAITSATNDKCSDDNLRCEYPEGVCVCSPPMGGPALLDAEAILLWSCNPSAGCPMPRPRLGASCSTTLSCTYQSCEFGESCIDGYWQQGGVACVSAGQ